jgi:hypothetical protein
MKLVAVFVALVTLASGGFQGRAPLRAAVFTTGLQLPVAFVADPSDPSIFYAVEQGGRIRVVRNRVVAEDFLDLRTATVAAASAVCSAWRSRRTSRRAAGSTSTSPTRTATRSWPASSDRTARSIPPAASI